MTIEFSNIPQKDPKADAFIYDEILVDTYGEEEQLSAWYTYLEDELPFPFQGMILTERKGNSYHYSQVKMERLAPIERCSYHQMWVMGRFYGSNRPLLHFFLADFKSVESLEAYQPIYYWKYWSRRR